MVAIRTHSLWVSFINLLIYGIFWINKKTICGGNYISSAIYFLLSLTGRSLPWRCSTVISSWKISKYLYFAAYPVTMGLGLYFFYKTGNDISTMVLLLVLTTLFFLPLIFNYVVTLGFGILLGSAIGMLSLAMSFLGIRENFAFTTAAMLSVSVLFLGSALYFLYTIYCISKEFYQKQNVSAMPSESSSE